MNKYIELSVHQLVDFLLRQGDIDDRYFNTRTMQKGTEIHKYYQEKQGGNYISEVNLSSVIKINDYTFKLSGRCDGLIVNKDEVIIDEIKSFNGDLQAFFEKNEVWHLGQAECYAYMYAKEHDVRNIKIYLTYISQSDRQETIKNYEYDFETLEEKIKGYLIQYIDFYKILEYINKACEESIKQLEFPFPYYRNGQEDMINLVEKTYLNDEVSYIEAPTGIGKTMGAIYGTLKSYLKKKVDKIFYLTPKNSGFNIAISTFSKLALNGLKVKVITLHAKEKMCLCEEKVCNPDHCPFTRNYYDKLKHILKEALIGSNIYTEDYLKKLGLKHTICPFEFSLDLSTFCNYIICDYNYVFHPISALKRYFETPDYSVNHFLLIDEAHNLISRSRDMYSSSINTEDFSNVKKALKEIKNTKLKNALSKVVSDFNLLKKLDFCRDFVEKSEILIEAFDENFIKNLAKLLDQYRTYTSDHPDFKDSVVNNFFIEVNRFLTLHEMRNDNFALYVRKYVPKKKEEYELNIFCLNASDYVKEKIENTSGSVLFSATLSPLPYYKDLLTQDLETNDLALESPYEKSHLNLLVNKSLSLLYSNRKESFPEVCKNIETFIDGKVGNYLVFAPSFEYLSMLMEKFKKNKDIKYVFQSPHMTVSDRNSFLENFKFRPTKSVVAFTVMGGVFSESIDLIGDRLIGVVIIGIGLPSFDFRNNLLKEYYIKEGFDGYNYAYGYVGLNHVMQAVGRLIRTENDRGSALLIDQRYGGSMHRKIFERWWPNYTYLKNVDDIKKSLKDFYKSL